MLSNLPFSDGVTLNLKELLSYQAKAALVRRPSKGRNQRMLSGPYISNVKGRGMEFDEVRHYQPGDDIRSIDWRVTARTGKTHTKLFKEEKERPVLILLDQGNSMRFGSKLLFKSVQGAHLAAYLCWQAKHRNDRVGGLVFNQEQHVELKPSARAKGVMQFLHATVELGDSTFAVEHTAPTLSRHLQRITRLAHTGCQIHLISDFSLLDAEGEKQLNLMNRHNQVTAWQITDPMEQVLPSSASLTNVLVRTTKGQGYLNRSGSDYQKKAQTRQSILAGKFTRQGIPLLQLSSDKPLFEQLK